MPRTGRPRGRPVGSGRYSGPQITVRLTPQLHALLTGLATGRRIDLAEGIRQACQHYFTCTEKATVNKSIWKDTSGEQGNISEAAKRTLPAKEEPKDHPTPGYDTSKYILGPVCANGHAYQGTGQSLRRLGDNACLRCHAERARAYRERQKDVKAKAP